MRRSIALVCVLASPFIAFGQAPDTDAAESAGSSGDTDLISGLWNLEDATPLETGQVDLRLQGTWATGQHLGDSSDDWTLSPSIVWGMAENWELSVTNKIWLGDGGDMGPFEDGNYDTDLGLLWRIHEQLGFEHKEGYLHLPSIALSTTFRIPTGCGSSGVDAELRLIMTYEYESGIRTHLNAWGKSANGDNFDLKNIDRDSLTMDDLDLGSGFLFARRGQGSNNTRDWQYGGVIGADGPLCGDGAVRWVADYMYRTSGFDGFSPLHVGEVGFEWELSDASKLGFSVQASLDHNDSQHQWGMGFAYTCSIG